MSAPNLVLKYTLAGDTRLHVRGAVRIKVDGCGALTVYGAEDGKLESVSLDCLRSLTIQSIPDPLPCLSAMIQ